VRSLPVRYGSSNARRSKPKLGQNFLVSPTAPRAIVDALGDLSQATVLEIGPGRGALTGLLAARAKHVIAVELDAALAASLQGNSVEVLCQDILKVDLPTAPSSIEPC
jgi:16S rRNA (adenine1518-N6/adenine1519-N6)-dimethyltransferase